MPTNPNSPFGFRKIDAADGVAPTFGTRKGLIIKSSNVAMFVGDPVNPLSSGYYTLATTTGGTGAAVGGIISGFKWISLTANQTVYRKYWPGTGTAEAADDIEVEIETEGIFEVQCLLGPITQASVGKWANFAVGAGGRTFGAGNQSSYSLDDGTINATQGSLPFEIYRLPVQAPGASLFLTPGYDPANAYNKVWVRMANLTL